MAINSMKTFKFGISLYLGSGYEKNLEVVKKANQANIRYAFTSLHIPEEAVTNYQEEVKRLLDLCKKYQLHL